MQGMDEDAAEQPQSLKKKIVGNQLCGLLIVMHSFFFLQAVP